MKKFKLISGLLVMFLAFFILTGYTNNTQKNSNTIKVTYTLKLLRKRL